MESDEYFEDDFDSSFLNEVDAIEAAHVAASAAPATRPPEPRPSGAKPPFKPAAASKPQCRPTVSVKLVSPSRSVSPRRAAIPEGDDSSDYYFDDPLTLDEADCAEIDAVVERRNAHSAGAISARSIPEPSGQSSLLGGRHSNLMQRTLFGEVVFEVEPPKTGSNARPFQRTRSSLRQMPLPGQAKRTKQWDRTAYAKTGWRKPKPNQEKGKGKGRASDNEDDEEPIEFEQFPAAEVPVGPIPPMKLYPDRLAAKTWIYPLNKPKRDYQYNIVKKCLLENTLVALPTGLGKTFIAGVVMLNFYNWFPQGKVVFVAPTKPLVAQQIDACHKTCGIPGSAAAELTGNVAKDKRINAWRTKRVFYATPQTLLNDLVQGHVDPLDIVLIVIDEAHRGTGDYAYAQVVRYMMQHNPHHRILALTATPGGKPEVVQDIVDALHISHIEIRSETDPDLKKYLHTKHEQEHFVEMTEDIIVLRDALSAVMVPIIKKVQGAGFLKTGNTLPTLLHPYRCQATLGEMSKVRAPQYAVGAAAQLGPLARAMGYLMEMSISMCYGFLKEIVDSQDNSSAKNNLRKSDAFKSLMAKFEEQAARGISMHPKMDVLRTLLIDHFGQRLPDEADGSGAQPSESRAMVFVSFRQCVEEVVELLNKESPIIRAKPFIGQGTDKQGKKGYAQKEQLEVIEQFKAGKYNVLVSTSIGEEGLDIGEVDLIVCYDAQKTPIRMLQRIGRTGRKASGTVHVLLAKGREEHNWQKAQSSYAEVQHFIVRASDLEVYGDVDRLLPPDIEPESVEMEMEIEPYVREERASRKGSNATGDSPRSKKHKRNDDPTRNMPVVAAKGFVSVSELLVKNGATRKKTAAKLASMDWEHADEDDSDDADIEAGLFAPRRVKSTSAAEAPKGKGKARIGKKPLSRSATVAGPSKKTSVPKKSEKQATLAQLDLRLSDDTEDEAIEQGPLSSAKPRSGEHRSVSWTSVMPPAFRSAKSALERSSSPDIPLNHSTIDISSTSDSPPTRSAAAMLGSSSPDRPLKRVRRRVVDSSPERPLKSTVLRTNGDDEGSNRSQNRERTQSPERPASPPYGSVSSEYCTPGDNSMAWLIEDDEDPDLPLPTVPGPSRLKSPIHVASDDPLFLDSSPVREMSPLRLPSDDELEFVDDSSASLSPRRPTSCYIRSPKKSGLSHKTDMGPPALPSKVIHASPSFSDDMGPEPSFAIRPLGRQVRKRLATDILDPESSPLAPPASQRRLKRDRPKAPSPPPVQPPKKKKLKFMDTADAQYHNPWIDVEATHSGDEMDVGSSEPDIDYIVPDSDDHLFLEEPAETQMSPSYDQAAVYRRSLMTQAPGGSGGPVFANKPVRLGQASFGSNYTGSARYRRRATSSPPVPGKEDEYEFGSFIVDDDADISFTNAPSSDS
ncbi:P-loop containing nucleoside triphosphate hydrolase protein [Ganoderma leucocontextum]|nr:P-loop containing nucleoside triphosphate hydrolase protein [Ganoderma leucocontextum]